MHAVCIPHGIPRVWKQQRRGWGGSVVQDENFQPGIPLKKWELVKRYTGGGLYLDLIPPFVHIFQIFLETTGLAAGWVLFQPMLHAVNVNHLIVDCLLHNFLYYPPADRILQTSVHIPHHSKLRVEADGCSH